MTLTLTLTPEKETLLADQARRAGLSVDDYVQEIVDSTATARAQAQPPRTGADLIAQWQREGAFLAPDPDMDSPALAREIREKAQTRQ